MSRMVFVNLPVADLDRSIAFFTELGFSFDPRFTDGSATCMNINDQAFAMLIVDERFSEFTSKPTADAHAATEVLLCVTAESREAVDRMADTALTNGGKPAMEPMDEAFMYGRSFHDPDGHHWEVMWLDGSDVPA
jgi:uncharacterized protein